jgi:hypothetical protein
MTENPTCIALLLCDLVIDDKRSNNKSYIGAFNAIFAPALPCAHPRFTILVSVTNLIGIHELTLTIKSPSDKKVFESKGPAESPNPLQVVDMIFEILGFPVEEEGTYFIDAFCDGFHVGTRRFQVFVNPPASA